MIHGTQMTQISQKQGESNIYATMKTMCPSGFYHGFVATHVLGHMVYSYTLLVPMNQTVLNKVSKEHNISDHKWSTTQRVRKSHRGKMSVIYALPVITTMSLWYIVFMIAYILRSICICEVSALCVVDHLWLLILCTLFSLLRPSCYTGTSNV